VALQEVQTLMGEIRQAWRDVPNLLPAAKNLASNLGSHSVH